MCIQIQGDVASGLRETDGANEGPDFAARGGNELRQFFLRHAASHHSRIGRLRVRQFDVVAHRAVRENRAGMERAEVNLLLVRGKRFRFLF